MSFYLRKNFMVNSKLNDVHQQANSGFFDILLAIVKHQKLFLFIWIIISLSGVIAAVLMPAKYSYTTLIGLGTNYAGNQLESISITRAKLNAVIIPVAQRKYIDDGGVYDVSVNLMVKSPSMILLESRGLIESAEDNLNFHKTISEELFKVHQSILTNEYEKAILPMNKIRDKIKKLEKESLLLNNNLKRLDDMDAALKRQAIESDANLALLHIILNNQFELTRTITQKNLADNTLALDKMRNDFINIENNLDGQRKTFYAVPPTQSKSEVAPNRLLIAVGGILCGFLIGVFGVLLVDFLPSLFRKVK